MSFDTTHLDIFELNETEIDPTVWGSGFVQYMVEYAAGVILQRSTAGMKDATEEERQEARAKATTRILKGEIPTKGGGGGARLTPEVVATRQVVANVLNAQFSFNKTEAERMAAKEGWFALFRQYVIDEAKAEGEDPSTIDFASLFDPEVEKEIISMHQEAYNAALTVAKGGKNPVKKTGFLKK